MLAMTSQLQAELKQHKPFTSLAHEASVSLKRTSAQFEYVVEQALKPLGITGTQYNALRILRGAGSEGLCRNEIRDRLIARVPDATRLLDRLEEMGLAVRSREGEDRRFVLTRITKKGLDLLHRFDGEIESLHEAHFGSLGQQKLRQLIEMLDEIRRNR